MKKAKIEQIGNRIQSLKSQENKDKFLSEIHTTILEIRKSEKEKYSVLSSIFNCFYENKTTSLPQQAIYDYIHQDIINYNGKMIVSFVENGTNSMQIIDENNYIKKVHNIISRNKCLIPDSNNHISFDMKFIQKNKNLMYRNLFGKNGKLFSEHKKLKNIKNPNVNKEGNKKNKNETAKEDDFEIEILESEEEESNTIKLKKENNNLLNDINPLSVSNSSNLTKITFSPIPNNIDISINQKDIILLNKKRKNQKQDKKEEQIKNIVDNKMDENTNILKANENRKDKKEEIVAEKEILSLIEEGKIFLSLFKDKELKNEFENQNNNDDKDDDNSFLKSILLNYHNNETLKQYLDILNNDFTEFQNSLKTLIDYKSSFDDSNTNKFIAKFTIMNKIILGKEKCNLLIDKIIIKLKQLILEYNFIKKVLNNVDDKKAEFYQKFKEILDKDSKITDRDDYVNELKKKLKYEVNKAFVTDKEKNEK